MTQMKVNLQITTCCHREIMAGTAQSLELMRLGAKLLYIWLVYPGDALISRCRSIACTHFLERNTAPYMLFIDDDILFKSQDVFKIYQDMKAGYDVIGGCYAVKDGTQLASFGWEPPTVDFDGRIIPCKYIATGFMGISRKALEAMRDKLNLKVVNELEWCRCYPFFEARADYENENGPIYLSEDYDFCLKAQRAGIQTHLDTSIWLGHQGIRYFSVQDVINHNKQLKESGQFEQLVKKKQDYLDKIRKLNANSGSGKTGSD